MRRRAGLVASALILIVGLSVAGATAASAGGGVLYVTYPNGDNHSFGCTVGSKGSTQSEDGQWPSTAANGCATRVRLYSESGEQGNTLCLSYGTGTTDLDSTWKSYRIESALFC